MSLLNSGFKLSINDDIKDIPVNGYSYTYHNTEDVVLSICVFGNFSILNPLIFYINDKHITVDKLVLSNIEHQIICDNAYLRSFNIGSVRSDWDFFTIDLEFVSRDLKIADNCYENYKQQVLTKL